MKKLLVLFISSIMLLTMIACSGDDDSLFEIKLTNPGTLKVGDELKAESYIDSVPENDEVGIADVKISHEIPLDSNNIILKAGSYVITYTLTVLEVDYTATLDLTVTDTDDDADDGNVDTDDGSITLPKADLYATKGSSDTAVTINNSTLIVALQKIFPTTYSESDIKELVEVKYSISSKTLGSLGEIVKSLNDTNLSLNEIENLSKAEMQFSGITKVSDITVEVSLVKSSTAPSYTLINDSVGTYLISGFEVEIEEVDNIFEFYTMTDENTNTTVLGQLSMYNEPGNSHTKTYNNGVLSISGVQNSNYAGNLSLMATFLPVEQAGTYTKMIRINSDVAGDITINMGVGVPEILYTLVVGNNDIELTYNLGANASPYIKIYFGRWHQEPVNIGNFNIEIKGFTMIDRPDANLSGDIQLPTAKQKYNGGVEYPVEFDGYASDSGIFALLGCINYTEVQDYVEYKYSIINVSNDDVIATLYKEVTDSYILSFLKYTELDNLVLAYISKNNLSSISVKVGVQFVAKTGVNNEDYTLLDSVMDYAKNSDGTTARQFAYDSSSYNLDGGLDIYEILEGNNGSVDVFASQVGFWSLSSDYFLAGEFDDSTNSLEIIGMQYKTAEEAMADGVENWVWYACQSFIKFVPVTVAGKYYQIMTLTFNVSGQVKVNGAYYDIVANEPLEIVYNGTLAEGGYFTLELVFGSDNGSNRTIGDFECSIEGITMVDTSAPEITGTYDLDDNVVAKNETYVLTLTDRKAEQEDLLTLLSCDIYAQLQKLVEYKYTIYNADSGAVIYTFNKTISNSDDIYYSLADLDFFITNYLLDNELKQITVNISLQVVAISGVNNDSLTINDSNEVYVLDNGDKYAYSYDISHYITSGALNVTEVLDGNENGESALASGQMGLWNNGNGTLEGEYSENTYTIQCTQDSSGVWYNSQFFIKFNAVETTGTYCQMISLTFDIDCFIQVNGVNYEVKSGEALEILYLTNINAGSNTSLSVQFGTSSGGCIDGSFTCVVEGFNYVG